MNLSRQKTKRIPQKINFTERLEEDNCVRCFYNWKAAKPIPNFSFNSLVLTE